MRKPWLTVVSPKGTVIEVELTIDEFKELMKSISGLAARLFKPPEREKDDSPAAWVE